MLDFHIASPEEKRAVFAAVHAIWPHADDPGVHLLKRLHSVQHARAEWFVGSKEGVVVASCGAYPLRLYGPDGERAARGFGAVYTDPAHRGKGHAEALLKFVMNFYQSENVDDFILFSDIAPAYYARIGFHLLPSWRFEIEGEALPKDSAWGAKKIPAFAENPGSIACEYGIQRSSDDDIWTMAKHGLPIRKTLFEKTDDGSRYWILSSRSGLTYGLLESNIPQDEEHWPLFKTLVAADCARAKCSKALGWWASAPVTPPMTSHVSLRKDGILMWASGRGEADSWFPHITQKSFRTFLSEQF